MAVGVPPKPSHVIMLYGMVASPGTHWSGSPDSLPLDDDIADWYLLGMDKSPAWNNRHVGVSWQLLLSNPSVVSHSWLLTSTGTKQHISLNFWKMMQITQITSRSSIPMQFPPGCWPHSYRSPNPIRGKVEAPVGDCAAMRAQAGADSPKFWRLSAFVTTQVLGHKRNIGIIHLVILVI